MSTQEVTTDGVATRDRLALALDVDDLVEAIRLGRLLRPWFGTAKVGLELFSAAGPEAIGAFADLGYRVFLDLKLHDIPTTVHRAARVLGALGVDYLTLHAQGGVAMLRAGVDGLVEGAERAGLQPPTALAVTILTSDDDAPEHILPKRVGAAVESGCGGIVCAAGDVRDAALYRAAADDRCSRHPSGGRAASRSGACGDAPSCARGRRRSARRWPRGHRIERPESGRGGAHRVALRGDHVAAPSGHGAPLRVGPEPPYETALEISPSAC